jgi:glycosyltransferase involved in cell wall biosynthesis
MKVSVVMTCYNTSHFVGEAIASVVNQTYKNWELVIVDDASTDNTVRVVAENLNKFKIQDRSKVLYHKENCGCGKSLSDAINASSGELIAVLDSDDVLSRNVLSLVVSPHIANKDISLVYTNYMECGSKLEPRKIVRNFQMPKGKTYLDYMKGVSHLKCFKKSFYQKTEGLNQRLLKSVDKDLVLKLEEVGRLFYIDTIGYYHREHSNNISNSFFKKPKDLQLQMRKDRKDIMENARIRRRKSVGGI